MISSITTFRDQIKAINTKSKDLVKKYPEIDLKAKELRNRFDEITKTKQAVTQLLESIIQYQSIIKRRNENSIKKKASLSLIKKQLKAKKLDQDLQDKDIFLETISNLRSKLLDLSNRSGAISLYLSSQDKINILQRSVDEVVTDKEFIKNYREIEDKAERSKFVAREVEDTENLLEDLIKNKTNQEKERDAILVNLGQIKLAENRTKKIEDNTGAKERQKNQAKFAAQIINGIYPRILSYKINKITHLVNSYLLNFTNSGNSFQIKMENTEKDLLLKVVRGTTANKSQERPISTLSGGEKMSLAFALRIAISKELAETGFMVLDEPTDGLDDERKQQVARLVDEQSFINQLFVISHDSAFDNDNNAAIKVSRDSEGATKIEGQTGFGMDLSLPTD